MLLLLSLLIISFYICTKSSLLYLFHTISAYIIALSLYSFSIKLLLYFSYFLQDSLTYVRITLMCITFILSTVATYYICSLHLLICFILLYFSSHDLCYSSNLLSGHALSYLVLLAPFSSCI